MSMKIYTVAEGQWSLKEFCSEYTCWSHLYSSEMNSALLAETLLFTTSIDEECTHQQH